MQDLGYMGIQMLAGPCHPLWHLLFAFYFSPCVSPFHDPAHLWAAEQAGHPGDCHGIQLFHGDLIDGNVVMKRTHKPTAVHLTER